MKHRLGFTLVELSIVLVIVALIVGGIFVGVDMIRAAKIRAIVSQYEKYSAAVNTFRTKYNGLPGDLLYSDAAALGLYAETAAGSFGTAGNQDGNGMIEAGASGSNLPSQGETLIFWRHLSEANLIEGVYGTKGTCALNTSGNIGFVGTAAGVINCLPLVNINRNLFFTFFTTSGDHYYELVPLTMLMANLAGFGSSGLTPVEANNIDIKLDDGLPNTGKAVARSITAMDTTASWTAASTAAKCMQGGASATDTSDTYNLVPDTGGNTTSCSLRLRFK